MDYREAGVDIAAGRAFVDRIRDLVQGTYRPGVLGGLGSFGGCFELPTGYQQPVLVSGTDGVGTKLKLAQQLNQHDTVGIDLVAMCANDVLTSGAEPLYFLDYLATGKLDSDCLEAVVRGIATGCKQANCALLGGETAEMPGFYPPGEYDLAGFCVGIAEKSALLDGSQLSIGDVAIGLASTGVHSNGFSLVRSILDQGGYSLSDTPAVLGGVSLGEALIAPTQIYVDAVKAVNAAAIEIHAMAHITGGGLPENLPRCLGPGQAVQINAQRWTPPAIFRWIAEAGDVAAADMFDTFNMGLGFIIFVAPDRVEATLAALQTTPIAAWPIGETIAGSGDVQGIPLVDR
ncbi:MAG: phosphoribosylformylglycinamidine cyclo-ligase [Oscillatoriales cyanobacterium]|nr:MAG: phosphoribosylformylglycinamidine cyclo-ligase [Oscillatoriales cyanobacterium]